MTAGKSGIQLASGKLGPGIPTPPGFSFYFGLSLVPSLGKLYYPKSVYFICKSRNLADPSLGHSTFQFCQWGGIKPLFLGIIKNKTKQGRTLNGLLWVRGVPWSNYTWPGPRIQSFALGVVQSFVLGLGQLLGRNVWGGA